MPGDIVQVEAGDIVPADGRIVRSATLETQEAALTGESAPIAKDAARARRPPTSRSATGPNMLFQNTSVTRGTGAMVVTATGMRHRDGPDRDDADLGHAHPVAAAEGARLADEGPRRHRLGRGRVHRRRRPAPRPATSSDLLLLGTAMAISAIPTGMPAFVSGLLSLGAKQLAEAKAVVKNLTDVETLGATSAINTDKTGTLTMNQMMVSTIYAGGSWFTVEGEGYRKTGAITSVAGVPVPDFTRLALGLALDSDATVGDDGAVIGDPTEAALVVLAAKLGVDAEETRRAYPRLAEVPFDSDYKFMATFHRVTVDGARARHRARQGRPRRRPRALHAGRRPAERLAGPDRGGARGHRRGQRADGRAGPARARVRGPPRRPTTSWTRWPTTRCRSPRTSAFVGMVGHHRPAARRGEGRRRRRRSSAGIDVRMITGDHAVTAQAIGEALGLGPGAISGTELQALSDEELVAPAARSCTCSAA